VLRYRLGAEPSTGKANRLRHLDAGTCQTHSSG